jgi:hypothetical protein
MSSWTANPMADPDCDAAGAGTVPLSYSVWATLRTWLWGTAVVERGECAYAYLPAAVCLQLSSAAGDDQSWSEVPPTALLKTPTGRGGFSEAYRSRAKNHYSALQR